MLWDGLGFFGTDHMKLGRLQGEKVDFCTFFKSPKTLVLSLVGLSVAIYLILTEAKKLDMPKSQTISLIETREYTYHFSDAIALHAGNWFYNDQVFDRILKH